MVKFVNFKSVPAFTEIFNSLARDTVSKRVKSCTLDATTNLSIVVCPIPLAG